ncbi:MAG: hypothetical protein MUF49_19120 [Oculatellaceae cyanobacterium Prado106]|jgi:hypothetical protein|nr:hypothetical protein [Oculatellaceae cyanobacterium Prado106]
MTRIVIDTDSLNEQISEAALDLQSHLMRETDELYGVEDLEQALANWLELSVEALVDDVLFHVVEGDRSTAFNRRAFEIQLNKLPSVPLATLSPTPYPEPPIEDHSQSNKKHIAA